MLPVINLKQALSPANLSNVISKGATSVSINGRNYQISWNQGKATSVNRVFSGFGERIGAWICDPLDRAIYDDLWGTTTRSDYILQQINDPNVQWTKPVQQDVDDQVQSEGDDNDSSDAASDQNDQNLGQNPNPNPNANPVPMQNNAMVARSSPGVIEAVWNVLTTGSPTGVMETLLSNRQLVAGMRRQQTENHLGDAIRILLAKQIQVSPVNFANQVVQNKVEQIQAHVVKEMIPELDKLRTELLQLQAELQKVSTSTSRVADVARIEARVKEIRSLYKSLQQEFTNIENELREQYGTYALELDAVKDKQPLTTSLTTRLDLIANNDQDRLLNRLRLLIVRGDDKALVGQDAEVIPVIPNTNFFLGTMLKEINDLWAYPSPKNETGSDAAKRKDAHQERMKPLLALLENNASAEVIKQEIDRQQEIKQRLQNQVEAGEKYFTQASMVFSSDEKDVESYLSEHIAVLKQCIAQLNDPEKVLTNDELGGVIAKLGNAALILRTELKSTVEQRIALGEKIDASLQARTLVKEAEKVPEQFEQLMQKLAEATEAAIGQLQKLKNEVDDNCTFWNQQYLEKKSAEIDGKLARLWDIEKERVLIVIVSLQLEQTVIEHLEEGIPLRGFVLNAISEIAKMKASSEIKDEIIAISKNIDLYNKRINLHLAINQFVKENKDGSSDVITDLIKLSRNLVYQNVNETGYAEIAKKAETLIRAKKMSREIDELVEKYHEFFPSPNLGKLIEALKGLSAEVLNRTNALNEDTYKSIVARVSHLKQAREMNLEIVGFVKRNNEYFSSRNLEGLIEELNKLAEDVLDPALSGEKYGELVTKAYHLMQAKEMSDVISNFVGEHDSYISSSSLIDELKKLSEEILFPLLTKVDYDKKVGRACYLMEAQKTGIEIEKKINDSRETFGKEGNSWLSGKVYTETQENYFAKLELLHKMCVSPEQVGQRDWNAMIFVKDALNFKEVLIVADGYVDLIGEHDKSDAKTTEESIADELAKFKSAIGEIDQELTDAVKAVGDFDPKSKTSLFDFFDPTLVLTNKLETEQHALIERITTEYNKVVIKRKNEIFQRFSDLMSRAEAIKGKHPLIAKKEVETIQQSLEELKIEISVLSDMNGRNKEQLDSLISMIYFLDHPALITAFNNRLEEVAKRITAFIENKITRENMSAYFALIAVEGGHINKLSDIAVRVIGRGKFNGLLTPPESFPSGEMQAHYEQSVRSLLNRIENPTSSAEEINEEINNVVAIKESIAASEQLIAATKKLAGTYSYGDSRLVKAILTVSATNVYEYHLALKTLMEVMKFLNARRHVGGERINKLWTLADQLDSPTLSYREINTLVSQAKIHMSLITTGEKISTYLNDLLGKTRKLTSVDMGRFDPETQARINSLLLLEKICENPDTRVEGLNAKLSRYTLHAVTGLHNAEQISFVAQHHMDAVDGGRPQTLTKQPQQTAVGKLKDMFTRSSDHSRKEAINPVRHEMYKGTYEEWDQDRHMAKISAIKAALRELRLQLFHDLARLQQRGDALEKALRNTVQLLADSLAFLEAAQSLRDSFSFPVVGPIHNKIEGLFDKYHSLHEQYRDHQQGKKKIESIGEFAQSVKEFHAECKDVSTGEAAAKKADKVIDAYRQLEQEITSRLPGDFHSFQAENVLTGKKETPRSNNPFDVTYTENYNPFATMS